EPPERLQDAMVIPVGDLGFRTRLTDAVNSGQEQIMRGRGSGAGLWPELLQQGEETGLLSRQPQSAGQAEGAQGGGKRHWGWACPNQSSLLVSGAKVAMMDDARFAGAASAFDDVVVDLFAILLRDEASHNRVIQIYDSRLLMSMEWGKIIRTLS